MSHSRRNATILGAIGGGAIALLALAISIGRLGLHTPVDNGSGPVIQVTSGSLYLLVLIVAALAGLLIGAIGYGVGAAAEPDAPRFGLRYLLPVSSIAAVIMAYAVLRIGVGGFGDINGGVVTISVLRMAITVLVMGAVSGGTTSGIADALARPEVFAFGGEALPSSSSEAARAMMAAVSAPLIAAVVTATFAIPLSLVLLELEGDAATIAFSAVGAIVLAGTTIAAARPWDKGGAS